jgi:hypothetical protein
MEVSRALELPALPVVALAVAARPGGSGWSRRCSWWWARELDLEEVMLSRS